MTLGAVGEHIAARIIGTRGYSVVARNLAGPTGEIDLVARAGPDLVVIEVKTSTGAGSPLGRIDAQKAARLWRLAASVGAGRVEYLGLRLSRSGVTIRWLPG